MIGLNKIGLNQVQLNLVQLNQLYLNTLCAGQKRSGGDGFPRLPGDVTRWSFKGLTNEMMAKNPRLEDADHKGRFLTFKNFAWGEMSGVGGYTQNYNNSAWRLSLDRSETTKTGHSFNVTSVTSTVVAFYYQSGSGQEPFTVKSQIVRVSGLTDGQSIKYGTGAKSVLVIESDGIYTLPPFDFAAKGIWYGFSFGKIQESCNITLEQLPYYPDALVFDGVDDYGICENFPILTKEKGYTVVALRQIISTRASSVVSKFNASNDGAFLFEGYNLAGKYISGSFGAFVQDIEKSPFSYMTSVSYNGTSINPGNKLDKSNTLAVGTFYNDVFNHYFGNIALWELIILDHDATEEELTKIKNYFIKTYPWLFFDQAWTVTGKTNEDTDRATIANITGNGNNLVLSNFGFAGNSGYGKYAYNWNEWAIDNGAATNVSKQYNKFVAVMPVNQSISTCSLYSSEVSIGTKFQFKLKITGLTTNWIVRVMEGYTGDSNIIYEFDKDGTYQIDHTMTGSGNQLRLYIRMYCAVPNTEGTTVTVEQIPDHEGYLVTDGVDDGVSSLSVIENIKDFTWVGEFIFPQYTGSVNYVGIQKPNDFILYNYYNSANKAINAFIKGTTNNKLINKDTVKAVCSEGLVYDENWNSIVVPLSTNINTARVFSVGYNPLNNNYGKMLFKNIGRIPRKLSKEDSIKAYIYLQTLKAK